MESSGPQPRQTVFIPPLDELEEVIVPSLWQRSRALLAEWWRRYRSRRILRRQLREMVAFRAELDVGLPVGSLVEEAGKPFWRA